MYTLTAPTPNVTSRRMSTAFPPRTPGGALTYCLALGLGYAAFTSTRERMRRE